jgi:acyl-CoA reductase-like NAD-dependent aldehyde dehydrogenase
MNIQVAPLIDGALSQSESDAAVDVINPSDGRRFLSIPAGSVVDVDRAVASARRAFELGHWSEATPSFKKQTLHRLADLIENEAATLDVLDAGEMGKPVSEALANGKEAAGLMRFYAEAVDKVMGDMYGSDKHSFVAQRQVPRGVVAAIVPWNFPTFNAVLKLGPALAAGNCVVLKPSELSSRSALRVASLALEAGLPPGVLNVVPGLGETVGRALGLHGDVDMIAFTGSTEVGKLMLQYAGQSNMKVVMAECGGKSPQIVFDDGVDLDAASESIAQFLLTNQGQICSVGSRLLVQRSIEPTMLEKISVRMRQTVIGDALDPKTTFGPLASAKQCSRVMQYIETAQAAGALLAVGGRRALQQTGGYFVEPTIFCNVSATARIAQEEIFGPVLSIIPFEDEAEALRIANSTTYGLAAYVWTANLSRGMRMAKGIRSPVTINAAAPLGEGAGHAAAWEPAGQSGMGIEGGLAGMESYLRRQLVWFNHE